MLEVHGTVFMPVITPRQKVNQTRMFGGQWIEVVLTGDNFDDCAMAAKEFTAATKKTFVPPFDDLRIIEGQGTVGLEILKDLPNVNWLFVPVGGGGLLAGVGHCFQSLNSPAKIVGIEPEGAPSMKEALRFNKPVTLAQIDPFVDGAAVKRVGEISFPICREVTDTMHLVPEGKICSTILKLYNEEAIVVEPAGAMSVAALDAFKENITGQNVVCIVSGSNNDIDRMPEIKERSLQYEGLKHYFLIRFAQRPGALREFVNEVLGPGDDITRFEYMQKTNKEQGHALVGVELEKREDYFALLENMKRCRITFSEINKDDQLFGYLV
jgi:threonine dehydratase